MMKGFQLTNLHLVKPFESGELESFHYKVCSLLNTSGIFMWVFVHKMHRDRGTASAWPISAQTSYWSVVAWAFQSSMVITSTSPTFQLACWCCVQIYHVYEVQCNVHSCLRSEVKAEMVSGGHYVTVTNIQQSTSSEGDINPTELALTLHITPRLDGRFFHHFFLSGKDLQGSSKRVRVSVEAKIFGKGQGTPLLKDHVRLLRRLPEADDSDLTL